jgi:hypothetical protein
MKNSIALIFLGVAMLLGSCKKPKADDDQKNNNSNNNNVPKGTLLFHLHTYIDENEVDLYNATYSNDEG